MAEKTMKFQGRKVDLDRLTKEVSEQLMSEGYQVQSTSAPSGIVIQVRKEGALRDVFAANRAFTILIDGKPSDFTVRIGIGKFVQNLAVTAAEAVVLSDLFLAVDVPEMVWTKVVEEDIAKNINNIVEAQSAKARA